MSSEIDLDAAMTRLNGVVKQTPVLRSRLLDERVGAEVHLKAENLQTTGAFKFRGAFNKISKIPEGQREKGIVAFSSGNHAQGVAAAAKILGIAAQVIMPKDAPAIKVSNTRALGAKILLYKVVIIMMSNNLLKDGLVVVVVVLASAMGMVIDRSNN